MPYEHYPWRNVILRRGFDQAIAQSSVTVTTTATALPSTPLDNRESMIIRNEGTNTVWIGNSSVQTSTGFPLNPEEVLCLDISDSVTVYGISTANQEVRILEFA